MVDTKAQKKSVDEIIKSCEKSGFKYALIAVTGRGNYFFERFGPDFERNLPPEKKAAFEKNSEKAGREIKKVLMECYQIADYGRFGGVKVDKIGRERGFLKGIPKNCKTCAAHTTCYEPVTVQVFKDVNAYRMKKNEF